MGIKRSLLVLAVLVMAGCQYLPWGKKEAKPIFVGEPETIIVEPPETAVDISYRWSILDLPDESLLVPDFLSSSNVFTFAADVVGDYSFSVLVESTNEEVADHIFRFIAVEDTSIIPLQQTPVAATPEPPAPEQPTAEQADMDAVVTAAEVTPPTPPPAKKPVRQPKPKPARREVPPDVVPGHFTIQVSSWKTAKQAQKVKQALDGMGYDTYIQRVWLEDRKEVWWRVRLGEFTDIDEARSVRNKLADKYADVWVDNVRKDVVGSE